MNTILSFGAGLQTTALAILVAEKKLAVDAVIFADTGCEKPETYSYMEDYTLPMLKDTGVEFITVRNEQPHYQGGLYEYLWWKKELPSFIYRDCTTHFKVRVLNRYAKRCTHLIGFSIDEAHRAKNRHGNDLRYPLIEMGLSVGDCRDIIQNQGFPLPLKSSCYICPFQPYVEWNWLKNNHPELFQKAIDLEERYYQRNPHMRNRFGLLRGTGLWRMKDGLQPEMLADGEKSCWSGYCSH